MDHEAKYPEKIKPGDYVKYALQKNDPEELWIDGVVKIVQRDQPNFVEYGTFCKFEDDRLGYVKKILRFREFSEKMILDLIQNTEGKEIERKSSFLVDPDEKIQKWWLKDQVVKEVAAFMNSKGGFVIIGQNDSGEIIGIDFDLQVVKKSVREGGDVEDKYISLMEDYIFSKLHDTRLTQLVEIQIPRFVFDGKKICIIKVDKSSRLPALVDVDVRIIDTYNDHFKEKDINGKPTENATNEHAWKNTSLKPAFYYVRLNQKTVVSDIRNALQNNI